MLNEKEAVLLSMRNRQQVVQRQEMSTLLNRWSTNFDIYTKLRGIGLIPVYWDTDLAGHLRFGPDLEVTQSDLPRLREAFAVVKDSGHYKVENVDENLVRVYLELGYGTFERSDWPWFVRVYYLKTLPPGSRCRIETMNETKAQVVCGVTP